VQNGVMMNCKAKVWKQVDKVLRDVKERDERDMTRKDAPLKPAHDAHILDTSGLSIMTSLQKAIDITSTAFVKAMKI
jgi:cytidylate kinase